MVSVTTPDGQASEAARIALWSVVVAIVVIGLKFISWRITGSVALFSDALESIVNLVAAVVALWAIRLAARPADDSHHFGHHKAEYLAAVFEGVLVVIAALLILHQAFMAILAGPDVPERLGTGLAVNLAAALINGLWAWYLLAAGRRLLSPALSADGRHLLSDVMTSAGVAGGLVLAWVSGIALLDPLLAGIVAVNVLWQGWIVISGSVHGLMDRAPSASELAELELAIKRSMDGATEYHDLKTRMAGRAVFIDMHLVVPGVMSVEASHGICDRIEAALKALHPGAVIQIHVEPEHKAKHTVTDR